MLRSAIDLCTVPILPATGDNLLIPAGICDQMIPYNLTHNHNGSVLLPLQSCLLTMKLIIVGATGLVGNELLRQSLLRSDITSIIAVTRRVLVPPVPSPKFKNIVVKDYDQYDDAAKSAFTGADGCIWYVPTQGRPVPVYGC